MTEAGIPRSAFESIEYYEAKPYKAAGDLIAALVEHERASVPYLVVEESDSAAWLLIGVYPTLDKAKASIYLTRDRSHGGRPYTWLRIVQCNGEDQLGEWRYDVDDAQAWVEVTS